MPHLLMKRRTRRIALATAAIGSLVVIAGLGLTQWRAVRDHAVAWRFCLTRRTAEIPPDSVRGSEPLPGPRWLFRELAIRSGRPVIYDPEPSLRVRAAWDQLPVEAALKTLREEGWRILEQWFPRRAYVVVGYPEARMGYGRMEVQVRLLEIP